MKALDNHWLILRTSSRNTLRLTAQLIKDGFDAWTPKRTFAKQGNGLAVTAPMLPSFAFARANHVHSLLALSDDPRCQIDFGIFTFLDQIPFVCDVELEPLRRIEANDLRRLEEGKAKRRKPAFLPGQSIRLTVGAYAGMTGKVVRDDGKYISIDLGPRSVKISSFHLGEESVSLAVETVSAKAA